MSSQIKGVCWIPLTQGLWTQVDLSDAAQVLEHKWHATFQGRSQYAVAKIRKPGGRWTAGYLHRFLLPGKGQVDHKNGDGLDNRRINLRLGSAQQNRQAFRKKGANTTSQFRGVCWAKKPRKWVAQIGLTGRTLFLGHFTNESDAARAYDAAAQKYFGDFASPNFPL